MPLTATDTSFLPESPLDEEARSRPPEPQSASEYELATHEDVREPQWEDSVDSTKYDLPLPLSREPSLPESRSPLLPLAKPPRQSEAE